MLRLGTLAVLLASLLAGCADDDPAPSEDDDVFKDQNRQTAAGTGVIRGVVLDISVAPIADATVLLEADQETTTTDGNGAFIFTDVEPGTHFITVSKPGWTGVQQSVEVVADVAEPDILKIQITADPSSAPRADTFSAEGFVQCGVGTPLTIHECPGLNDKDDSQVTLPYSGTPDHIQAEVLWESTQPAGEQLYLIVKTCGDPCDWGFDGRFSEGVMDSPHVARTSGNFTAGQLGVWASPGGPANGTGVALDQKFDVFGTFFYNMEPDDGWAFHSDGDHPV